MFQCYCLLHILYIILHILYISNIVYKTQKDIKLFNAHIVTDHEFCRLIFIGVIGNAVNATSSRQFSTLKFLCTYIQYVKKF